MGAPVYIYPSEVGVKIGDLFCRDAVQGDIAWVNKDPSGKRWLSLQTSGGDDYEIVKRSDSYDHALGMRIGGYGDDLENVNNNIVKTLRAILSEAGASADEEETELEPTIEDDQPAEARAKVRIVKGPQ